MFVVRMSLLLLAGIASVWLSFWLIASNIHYGYLGDFKIFWFVGQNPVDWLYTDLERLPFPYPPSSLWLFKPLGLLPFWMAFGLWIAASIGLFAYASRKIAAPLPVLIGLVSYPAILNLVNGQTGMIVGALVILGMTEKRPAIAGILLGIAAAVKPQSAVAIPFYLLLHQEHRTLLWAGITGAILIALSVLAWGFTPWLHWFSALDDFRIMIIAREIRTVGVWPYGLALAPFALLLRDRYVAVALGGLALSPYSMPYDLCGLTVVAIAGLLRSQSYWEPSAASV